MNITQKPPIAPWRAGNDLHVAMTLELIPASAQSGTGARCSRFIILNDGYTFIINTSCRCRRARAPVRCLLS